MTDNEFHRNLSTLSSLLVEMEKGKAIDPSVIQDPYVFCANIIHKIRENEVGAVTADEELRFVQIQEKLNVLLKNEITYMRDYFPTGCRKGEIKDTLTLLEQVMRECIYVPGSPEEFRAVVGKCLENNAHDYYSRINTYVNNTKFKFELSNSPDEKINDAYRLTQLCIDVLNENKEYYLEEFSAYSDLLAANFEIILSLYYVELEAALEIQHEDPWESIYIFRILNEFLLNEPTMNNGPFHKKFVDRFKPEVIRFIDHMGELMYKFIDKGFAKETWKPVKKGCATSEDVFWTVDEVMNFLISLKWPEKNFNQYLNLRIRKINDGVIEKVTECTIRACQEWMKKSREGTDPSPALNVCVMVKVMISSKERFLQIKHKLHDEEFPHHSNYDEIIQLMLRDMGLSIHNELERRRNPDYSLI